MVNVKSLFVFWLGGCCGVSEVLLREVGKPNYLVMVTILIKSYH